MQDKRILLIVGGGIAAYKALELVRLLRKRGARVRAVLTRSGAEFVTPLSLSALTEDKVYTDLFSLTDEAEMGHIQLSRAADLVVVAPATADLMARAAHGHASDLASTVLLATDKRVLMAPAMNVRMWEHPASRRNLERLRADGVLFVGPDAGAMACGEWGEGRLAEPEAIVAAIEAALSPADRPLAGRRALVTAGPTVEPLDPVRFLSNHSSGRQGYAIAEALAALGAEVTMVSGPTSLPVPAGVRRVDVTTAREMLAACRAALPADVAVMVAAVADWRPDDAAPLKLKKSAAGPPTIRFVENPDILATLAEPGPERPRLVIGFAAETNDVEAHARAKLSRKGCDWIVANDVSEPGVMGGGENRVTLVTARGEERWERAGKGVVAQRLAERVASALRGSSAQAVLTPTLLPGLPADRIRAAYDAAPGDELRTKFDSPRSSAALAANVWGFFLDQPRRLPPLPGVIERIPETFELEQEVRFPWSGGRHPWLDVLIDDGEALIGVESKRYEPFDGKGRPSVSDAFEREVWDDRMTGYRAMLDEAKRGAFARLDAAQLAKHALGLLTQGRKRGRKSRLFYIYAEPLKWPDGGEVDPAALDAHRSELTRFHASVADDEVEFAALSYRDLLGLWSLSGDIALRAHVDALKARFDL